MRLVHIGEPLLRLPNLAIHMKIARSMKNGLKFNKQTELPLVLGLSGADNREEGYFHALLAKATRRCARRHPELGTVRLRYAARLILGAGQEFIANGQLDNLASCHAGLEAYRRQDPKTTNVCAFFDHEEVGSESATGAGGSFIADVLRRIAGSTGLDDGATAVRWPTASSSAPTWRMPAPISGRLRAWSSCYGQQLVRSLKPMPASATAPAESRAFHAALQAGVPCQQYAHRADLG